MPSLIFAYNKNEEDGFFRLQWLFLYCINLIVSVESWMIGDRLVTAQNDSCLKKKITTGFSAEIYTILLPKLS